jgi:hypothetical protein
MDALIDRLLEEEETKAETKTAWSELFQGYRFFPRFEHFIKIDILS